MKRRKERIQPYVSADLRRSLGLFCARRQVAESAVVETSLQQFLTGTSDTTLLYRRLDSISRRFDQLQQALELQGELVNEFLKTWLRNTPPLPDPDAQATIRQARARYQALLERIAVSVSNGKTFVDELPKESLSPTENVPAPSSSGAD